MRNDPAVERVREARRRISAAVGHDPKRLVERYMRLQEQHKDRLVTGRGVGNRPTDETSKGS